MKNKILFIAGSEWQKYYLTYLKSLGHKIFIVNPFETETTKMADQHIMLDVKNIQGILNTLDALDFKPDAICGDQCEVAVLPIAKLSEILKTNSPLL